MCIVFFTTIHILDAVTYFHLYYYLRVESWYALAFKMLNPLIRNSKNKVYYKRILYDNLLYIIVKVLQSGLKKGIYIIMHNEMQRTKSKGSKLICLRGPVIINT